MIELPEALTLAKQLENAVVGKTVSFVLPPSKAHKFCWYEGDPLQYESKIKGHSVLSANGFGIFVELSFDNGFQLCFQDGVNARLISALDTPKEYQLLIGFHDGSALVFTVAMYGGILLHDGSYINEYYLKSRAAVSPFSPEFEAFFCSLLTGSKPTLSLKAFLATEQRFAGIGNGVLQDILFAARLHPKRKLGTLSSVDKAQLLVCITSVLREMTDLGGRDTEKDLFGVPGGYKTKLSKNTLAFPCPVCGGGIKKEAYLGGSIYFCPDCQSL